MKNILIINASGFGREVYWLITGLKEYGTSFVIKGFLDNRSSILNSYNYAHPVISSVEDYIIQENDIFVCAMSDSKYKIKYSSIIKDKGGHFMNIIHPTTLLSSNITFGEGVIIADRCGISCDVHIGNFVTINGFTNIGHDAYIDDYAHINSFCAINGNAKIGSSAFVGAHGVVLEKVEIGKNSFVGAGSVALRNVSDNTKVFGVPAVPFKT